MWTNPQLSVDLLTFTKEIFNGKRHFLCSELIFVNAGVNIGDGGRSWIEKAYERAVQQAKEEGVPLEDIVKKRWGVR